MSGDALPGKLRLERLRREATASFDRVLAASKKGYLTDECEALRETPVLLTKPDGEGSL